MDAAQDELKLTDVVLHTKQPRGVIVEAEVQHHSLHMRWVGRPEDYITSV